MRSLIRRVVPRSLRYVVASLRHAGGRQALWDRTLLHLKANLDLTRRMDYAGNDIFLHVDSTVESVTRLHSCAKEPHTIRWIEGFAPGDVFYDVGANVGAYSLVAAKRFAGSVAVYAFEPAFVNFSQLNRNILLNGCVKTITPFAVALSDRTAVLPFNYQDVTPGGSLHALGDARDHRGTRFAPSVSQAVLSFRLDDLVRQFAIPAPSHLKIDVDGIELSVLKGAGSLLADPTLRTVLVEAQEGAAETRIVEHLRAHGLHRLATHPMRTPGMLNCLFGRG